MTYYRQVLFTINREENRCALSQLRYMKVSLAREGRVGGGALGWDAERRVVIIIIIIVVVVNGRFVVVFVVVGGGGSVIVGVVIVGGGNMAQ